MRLAAMAAAGLLTAAACTQTGSGPPAVAGAIAIASDFPTSASVIGSTGVGLEVQHGVELALRDHPTAGRYRLRLIPFDYGGGPFTNAKGSQVMQEIANDRSILGVVGPFDSGTATKQIPIANGASLAIISSATTNDCLTLNFPGCSPTAESLRPSGVNNFFRLAPPDSRQGSAMADYAIDSLGITRVAVFSDSGSYGRRLAESFTQELAARHGVVVMSDNLDPRTPDYVPWLTSARAAGAQAIFAGGTDNARICFAREQAKQVFPDDVYFLGGDGIEDPTCLTQAQDNLSGRMYATLPALTIPADPSALRALLGRLPVSSTDPEIQAYALIAYDATVILINAIGQAIDANHGNRPSRAQVLAAVSRTAGYAGVTGTYSFDADGDALGASISIFEVQQKSWVPVLSVQVAAA